MELFALVSLALVAGLVSFTSPCTLPLLPGYVSYVSGLSRRAPVGERLPVRERRRTLAGAGLFVAGFSAVFTTLGATSSALGFLLASNLRVINIVGGTLIIVMGLATTGLIKIPLLHRQFRFDLTRFGRGPGGALPLGAAFAFGWTPCVGPVLASILATAASTATVSRGALLLLAYSLGLGLPFLLLASGLARGGTGFGWLRRHARRIEIVGGLLLVTMGVAVLTGGWTALMSRMLAFYARLGWPPI
ncbi:cytochrome c biogenesis CcdA family protein [Prauserella muralis]|uniref:Cytochrome C biogenesis protein n=1 Tax=Prauserella muralis TaxID=588067 RepID=A0A2V4AVS9_9PSEU|nr:cytochrome c biogenesis protein CcdA [Prauserella muralis]PXY25372.1 cytochrome C biogenesis protein [Prauserella muralis]TWE27482.1 cytochrome c-type biogenesis protein [Prauserella muralis]